MLNKRSSDLKVALKMFDDPKYPQNKHNVELAVQIFSNSNANALKFYGGSVKLMGMGKTLQIY